MNLRLSNNQLRFRVTHEEMAALFAGHVLAEYLLLPENNQIGYKITVAEQGQPLSICYNNHEIVLKVSPPALKELMAKTPSRDGIEYVWQGANGNEIKLALEVDVKKRRA